MSLSGTFSNPSLWSLYREGEDAMFEALKKPCKLYYAPSISGSANAVNLPIGQMPGFIDVHGSNVPLYNQGEPALNAEGYREVENYETIYMQVNWNSRTFASMFAKKIVNSPNTFCQTKFKRADFPKIQNAEYVILNNELLGEVKYEFVQDAEPIPNGMKQDAYYLCLWKRVA